MINVILCLISFEIYYYEEAILNLSYYITTMQIFFWKIYYIAQLLQQLILH